MGTAVTNKVKNIIMSSNSEYCLMAEMTPTGMPIITANRMPDTARSVSYTHLLGIEE